MDAHYGGADLARLPVVIVANSSIRTNSVIERLAQ